MLKRIKPWSFGKHLLLSALTVLGIGFIAKHTTYASMTRQAASIGIIGGADGPTSIFVAGKVASAYLYYILYGALLAVLLLLYKPLKSLIDRSL